MRRSRTSRPEEAITSSSIGQSSRLCRTSVTSATLRCCPSGAAAGAVKQSLRHWHGAEPPGGRQSATLSTIQLRKVRPSHRSDLGGQKHSNDRKTIRESFERPTSDQEPEHDAHDRGRYPQDEDASSGRRLGYAGQRGGAFCDVCPRARDGRPLSSLGRQLSWRPVPYSQRSRRSPLSAS